MFWMMCLKPRYAAFFFALSYLHCCSTHFSVDFVASHRGRAGKLDAYSIISTYGWTANDKCCESYSIENYRSGQAI